ncbi:MAG: aminotransferase class I/II-fold pyridoxal phosphate-dependent enzyme [Verrucomicrobiota bacterium]
MSVQQQTSYVAEHIRNIPRSGIRDFFEIVQSMEDVISLGIGEPDFVTPWHIREAAIYALEKGKTGYTSNLGSPQLRREISKYVGKQFGMSYDPKSEILVSVGVSEALDIALRAVLNPGDEVLFHEPCYVSYHPSVLLAHGVAVGVPTRAELNFSLTVEDLIPYVSDKTKVLMLNFPTNPTGATMSPEDLDKIAEFCVERDILVITDEIYSELTYEGQHESIATRPGMRERTIFLHGFSKAFAMTGFRVGYACAPVELTEAMMRIHQYSMLCASIISQEAATEALRNGGPAVKEMRDSYQQRRNYLAAKLNQIGLKCQLPRGSFYLFPSIKATGLSSRDFSLKLLEEKKVAVVPGDAFGASGQGFVRCSFATSMEEIEAAAENMAEFVKGL